MMTRGNDLIGFRIPADDLELLDLLSRITGKSRGDVLRFGLTLAAGRWYLYGSLARTEKDVYHQLAAQIKARQELAAGADAGG